MNIISKRKFWFILFAVVENIILLIIVMELVAVPHPPIPCTQDGTHIFLQILSFSLEHTTRIQIVIFLGNFYLVLPFVWLSPSNTHTHSPPLLFCHIIFSYWNYLLYSYCWHNQKKNDNSWWWPLYWLVIFKKKTSQRHFVLWRRERCRFGERNPTDWNYFPFFLIILFYWRMF